MSESSEWAVTLAATRNVPGRPVVVHRYLLRFTIGDGELVGLGQWLIDTFGDEPPVGGGPG